ncbi:tRNA lysidine(34) synthetase TilS [Yokenella regensburgei]|uniref:tRNA lysidine(34) synthetase TilS n=1 Tax=Yokenella regensburgei TaxID=158877 RepID=UPI003F16D15C
MSLPLLSHLPSSQRQFLVAFSGGLDSTVLLHRLVLWRRQQPTIALRAIHIHHGLSPNADKWVEHCQQQCDSWQVPLAICRVNLVDEGNGVEAQARKARYAAFEKALLPGELLLTAQHLDDQAETFLLALKRGSGPAGLAGMPETMPFAGSLLLRPLLNETRSALEAWAHQHGLSWIDDESNNDDRYDRNFLRLRVLPQLNARWPHFADAVARSAALCGEQEQLLDELLADELSAATSQDGGLLIAALTPLSAIRRGAILRRWLASRQAVMPSRETLNRIWNEVALAREDAEPCLRMGALSVRRYKGQLFLVSLSPDLRELVLAWPSPFAPLRLPGNGGIVSLTKGGELRSPLPDEPVSLRFQASGILHIVGRNGGRKLKKIWQERGVAPWQRETTPLLFYGEKLIAAAGQFVTLEGAVKEGDEGVGLRWEK